MPLHDPTDVVFAQALNSANGVYLFVLRVSPAAARATLAAIAQGSHQGVGDALTPGVRLYHTDRRMARDYFEPWPKLVTTNVEALCGGEVRDSFTARADRRGCRWHAEDLTIQTGSINLARLVINAARSGVATPTEAFLAYTRTSPERALEILEQWADGEESRPLGRWPGGELEIALLQHEDERFRSFVIQHLGRLRALSPSDGVATQPASPKRRGR